MPAKIINLAAFKTLLSEIVAERPEGYAYNLPVESGDDHPACFYRPTTRHDGTVSRCIIGEALSRLGMTDEELARHEGTAAYSVLFTLGFGEDVKEYAHRVQRLQDRGSSWSEAVRECA